MTPSTAYENISNTIINYFRHSQSNQP
jgi:hypothetical protein